MSRLSDFNKNTIELEEIEKLYKISEYSKLCEMIDNLIEEKEISIIKSSGGNGKTPTLYKKYRIIRKSEDNNQYLDEMLYRLSPKFKISYYKNHIKQYKEHREYILRLNDFINNHSELLETCISMNERSFQIWGREKFIQKEEGKTILKNLGLELDFLNYYDTCEPIAYYSMSKENPQNILVLENKDTYYTMRKHLINTSSNILGKNISTIIYGGGKNIIKAFKDFNISVEEYVSNSNNTIYYFGDLDYEGIVIYESFYKSYSSKYNITPFVNGYEKIIDKYLKNNIKLPKTKEKQNRNIKDVFMKEFSEYYKNEIRKILNNNLYIPQEIINITDL